MREILHLFLTWKTSIIFKVVVVERFHSITPSLPIRHLETRKGRGAPNVKRQGMLVGKFEFNS